jgi:hypothetical protein
MKFCGRINFAGQFSELQHPADIAVFMYVLTRACFTDATKTGLCQY